MAKKYHFLYKTIVPSTGQYYYGIHSTDNLNDGYQGSGALICQLKKNNVHMITGIVEFCQSRKEVLELEKKVVNNKLLKDTACLNLVTGGRFTPPTRAAIRKSTKKKISMNHKGKVISPETRQKISTKLKQHFSDPANRAKCATSTGRSAETKRKISEASKQRKHSDEAKAKIGQAQQNKVVSKQTRAKQSAAKKGTKVNTGRLYVTPNGTFRTVTEAANANNVVEQTILNRCGSKNASKNGYKIIYT